MTEQNFYIPTTYGNVYACFKPSTTGVLVVMIHGLAGTRNSVFFRDVPQLTEHATLRFDLAGHGRSEGIIDFGFARQLDQIEQIMKFEQFQYYKEVIYIGHSKGGNLAILAANEKSKVIAVAPRFLVNKYHDDSFQEGIDFVKQGNILQKEFGGKKFNISKEDIDELDTLDFNNILSTKQLQLFVISGTNDIFTQGDQTELFQQWTTGGVYKLDCGHFDFKTEVVQDKLQQILQ